MPRQLPLNVLIEKNKLASDGSFIWCLDIIVSSEIIIRVCRNTEDIIWRGFIYFAFPFQTGKINESQDGADNTLELKIDNTTQQLQALIDQNKGGNGVRVDIYLVNSKDLTNDTPANDWSFVVQDTRIDQNFITFTLGTEYSARTRRPLNRYLKNNCPFVYKGVKCGYNGNLPTCGKTLVECRNHNNSQRFGGFPGIDQKGVYL